MSTLDIISGLRRLRERIGVEWPAGARETADAQNLLQSAAAELMLAAARDITRGDGAPAALAAIAMERMRQIDSEGWEPAHDDRADRGQLGRAAAVYALTGVGVAPPTGLWPWAATWFKPKNRRRDLIRAGALIVAELERLERASGSAAEVA